MSEILALAQRIAHQAGPGEQIEAMVSTGRRTTVRAYQGEVEELTSAGSSGVGIRVIRDGRQGFAYAGSLDADVVAETLADARDNVQFAEFDEYNGLAEPDGVNPVELDLYHDALVNFDPQRKVELALELERLTLAIDPRVKGVRVASFSDSVGEGAVATSTGLAASGRGTFCYVSVSPLADDGEKTQIGYGFDVSRDPNLLDLHKAAREAVERTVRMIGATKPASRKLTVVLTAEVAADFFGIIGGMLGGDVVVKGRSPFADRMGDLIASPLVSLVDDPTNPASFGADSVDGEGLATRRNVLIDNGRLQSFVHNSYTARRMNTASTGSAMRGYSSTPSVGCLALAIAPGTMTTAELYRHVGDGILVQSVSGLHSGVNPVSGDFSVGVEGVIIRGGELAEAVREATIASTLQRMLLDVDAVGSEVEWLPGGDASAPISIRDISLSGV